MDLLLSLESILLTTAIIISLSAIPVSRVIIEAIKYIARKMGPLLLIIYLLIFNYALMGYILLGHKYSLFNNPFGIRTLLATLISFKHLDEFTDQHDFFISCVFMFPVFIVIRFTAINMMVAMVYGSVVHAQKLVKSEELLEGKPLTFKEFLAGSKMFIKKKDKHKRHGACTINEFISKVSLQDRRAYPYSELVEAISGCQNVANLEISKYSRIVGNNLLRNFRDKESMMSKYELIIFKLLAFTCDNQDSFFEKVRTSDKFRTGSIKLSRFYN